MNTIFFSLDDFDYCLSVAKSRQLNKEKKLVREQAYKPDKNFGLKLHLVGVLGEFAVAKFLNVKLNETIFDGADPGYDLEYLEHKIEVKASLNSNKKSLNLILSKRLHERKSSDLYVFVCVNHDLSAQINGCISWQRFDKEKRIGNFGSGDCYFVSTKSLSDLRVFQQHVLGF